MKCNPSPGLFEMISTELKNATNYGALAFSRVVIRRAGYLAFTAIFFWSSLVFGEQNKTFTIVGVKVDVTARSSAEARQKALADGQQRAFGRLMRRIVLSDDLIRVPKLGNANIDQYVLDFAVANEKNSPVRYIADLTYRFKAGEIRNLLQDLDINFAETASKPVLLLPVYEVAAVKLLWDNPNPWKKSLAQMVSNEGLVPIVLPKGDLRDIGIIGPEQAVTGDDPRIQAIASRYRVGTVMVAYASLSIGSAGQPVLLVDVISYGSDKRTGKLKFSNVLNQGEKIKELIRRTAKLTVAMIEDLWKEENFIQFEQDSVLAVMAPISSLTEWVEIKRRLKRIAVIQRLELVLFSRDEVRINIYYLGDEKQLSLSLAQADMRLQQEEGNWVIGLISRKGQ